MSTMLGGGGTMLGQLKHTNYLGVFAVDPTPTVNGQWWFNSTDAVFKFYNGIENLPLGGTVVKTVSMSADEFGRPNTNPPEIVDQDNLTLYSFTLNTDKLTLKFPAPYDYDSGDIEFQVIWTNDGGTDDNGKNVKWQIDYQVGSEGDVISGSHANSPKTVEDTYESASGFVEHHTAFVAIAAADFAGEQCIFIKLSAITPPATALSCEPHLIGLCRRYTAKRIVV